jgi:hypothetical protein
MAVSRFSDSSIKNGFPKYQDFENLNPISGYILWLDASVASSFSYSSGTVVSEWRDLSGNGYHFTQSTTAKQPTRTAGGQNGRAVVSFGGSGSTVTCLKNDNLNWSNSSFTVFYVLKPLNTTNYHGLLHNGTVSSYGLGISGATNQYAIFDTQVAPYPFNLAPTGSNADVTAWKSGGQSGSTVATSLWRNGTAASGVVNQSVFAAGNKAGIGANPDENGDILYANVCEILIYNSELSDANRNIVESYLKVKWGTP